MWLGGAGLMIAAGMAWAGGSPSMAPKHKAQPEKSQLAHKRAEVQHLREGVAAQEAGSQKAQQRLAQQDQEIAELQRRLQALNAKGQAPKLGH